ncbi:MAG: transcription initiation factor IIB [Candidatus Helarchaeota archaeon]
MGSDHLDINQIKNKCPECGGSEFINDYSRGEIICHLCGLVINERIIDNGPEWRAFSMEEMDKKKRTGGPTTYMIHDKGLSTVIPWENTDSLGKKISQKKKSQFYRLRKLQSRSRVRTSMDRNLSIAMTELNRLGSQLRLSNNIKEGAAVLYRKAVNKKLTRGRKIEAMISAVIYIECRIRKVPQTMGDIIKYTYISRKDLGKCYRILLENLNIQISQVDPSSYIPRFGSDLNISLKTQQIAIDIVKKASKLGFIVGKEPTGLAAASLYIAAILGGERRTQREIAEVAHITEVTIRNRYKELVNKLGIKITV